MSVKVRGILCVFFVLFGVANLTPADDDKKFDFSNLPPEEKIKYQMGKLFPRNYGGWSFPHGIDDYFQNYRFPYIKIYKHVDRWNKQGTYPNSMRNFINIVSTTQTSMPEDSSMTDGHKSSIHLVSTVKTKSSALQKSNDGSSKLNVSPSTNEKQEKMVESNSFETKTSESGNGTIPNVTGKRVSSDSNISEFSTGDFKHSDVTAKELQSTAEPNSSISNLISQSINSSTLLTTDLDYLMINQTSNPIKEEISATDISVTNFESRDIAENNTSTDKQNISFTPSSSSTSFETSVDINQSVLNSTSSVTTYVSSGESSMPEIEVHSKIEDTRSTDLEDDFSTQTAYRSSPKIYHTTNIIVTEKSSKVTSLNDVDVQTARSSKASESHPDPTKYSALTRDNESSSLFTETRVIKDPLTRDSISRSNIVSNSSGGGETIAIRSKAEVEPEHVIEISSIRTVRTVVSAMFLVIALVAVAVLTIYVINVKRRGVEYDQLMLLP